MFLALRRPHRLWLRRLTSVTELLQWSIDCSAYTADQILNSIGYITDTSTLSCCWPQALSGA